LDPFLPEQIMTEYEKQSLALLTAIASGISLLVNRPDENAVSDWQQSVTSIITSVVNATRPTQADNRSTS
jgi:hypothetical protein